MITADIAIEQLKERLPDIYSEIKRMQYDDSLYLSLGIVATFLNRYVENQEKIKQQEIVQFLEYINSNGDSEVQNAVGVSCIEHFKIATEQEARKILTTGLYTIWLIFFKPKRTL